MVIRINERVPTIVSDDSIISDNTDYEVEVRCDYEWIGSTIYAIILDENGDRYTSEPIKLVNNKFTLPAVVTKTEKLYIGFTNGTVMTTEPVIVEVKMSIKLYASGDAVPKPTPDVYFEIIQKLNAALLIADNSKQYRDEALAHKNTAGNYAEAASSSASTAQTKAAEAAASAQTASGVVNTVEAKAVRAETAATNAETKAGLAQGYAAAAETKAGEAEGYATSASQSASAASTSASNAAASAQTASQKAQEFGQNTYTKSEVDAKIAAATPTDYNQLKQKVDGMIAIDETPTADTEIDISLDPDQTEYELVEKSEFDAAIEELGNDLEELETEVDGKASAESVQNLNASKLSKPSTGIAVGKYFRVASIDSAGNPVLEACDLPVATSSNAGLMKVGSGLYTSSSSGGNVIIDFASEASINNRVNNRAVSAQRIPYAVKSAMSAPVSTTDPEWTDAEKLSARQRLGMDKEWVLKGEIVGDETDRGNIDTGVTVDLSGCREIVIKGSTTATGTSYLNANIGQIYYNYAKSGTYYFMGIYIDIDFAIVPIFAYNNTNTTYTNQGLSSAYMRVGYKISDITRFMFSVPSVITSCDIKIYAR